LSCELPIPILKDTLIKSTLIREDGKRKETDKWGEADEAADLFGHGIFEPEEENEAPPTNGNRKDTADVSAVDMVQPVGRRR